MRRLHPDPLDEIDPIDAYLVERRTPPARPWVLLDMVTSVDGATAIDGRSGGLGGPGDHQVFHALRSLADVILVGAGTLRAERYGAVRLSDEVVAARVARGQAPGPRVAVVSRSLDLDLSAELFETDPVVITCAGADPRRRDAVAEVAELVVAGEGAEVDLAVALAALRPLGELVVCEGGPILNASLAEAGCVDELCVTVAPLLVGGTTARLLGSAGVDPTTLRLAHVLADGDELYLRYVRT
jgi:riboflavin biosynthesis pyrimidine reductase